MCFYYSASDDEASHLQNLCSLVFDEMSIRKHVRWNGKDNEGFIDLGTQVDDDSLLVAIEALLFLVVPREAAWKNTDNIFPHGWTDELM
jgi:DNA transposase THAP9